MKICKTNSTIGNYHSLNADEKYDKYSSVLESKNIFYKRLFNIFLFFSITYK